MNPLEQRALQLAIDKARGMGVDPAPILALIEHHGNVVARRWAEQHPDEFLTCCIGAVVMGSDHCLCWEPVFDDEQTPPIPGDLECQPAMCADCAFRPGSPERSSELEEEALLSLPIAGQRFFCHQGIRRPTHYVHPEGHVVEADPSDYQPSVHPSTPGVPYQADGQPALICAGWAAHNQKLERTAT
jgi:hypothetical protein